MRWIEARLLQVWLLTLILLAAQAARAAPESTLPPDYRPPDTQGICPAIAQDYELCSSDQWSGNCADFVADAARLGEVYRSELREHPGWVVGLQTTRWWGCGSAHLPELRSLLARIDTPQARAVLAEEPYARLAPRAPAAPPPVPPPHPNQELDCMTPSTQAERDACAARNLARVKAEHERAFAACKEKVGPALVQELVGSEASWQKLLPLECARSGPTRDPCLVRAYEERTQSLATMHPQCAAADSK